MINSKTQLYGIIGHPVSHSLSPLMHNNAFQALGINAVYIAFDVTDLNTAIAGIKELGIKGLSVTIPHKEKIIEFVDKIDDSAREIGAINTLLIKDKKIFGYNTDWHGAVFALKEKTELNRKKVVVIGAGGSSKAICYGLNKSGASIHIINRSIEKARELASNFNAGYSGLNEKKEIYGDILINTTSIGMTGSDAQGQLPIDEKFIQNFKVVMDIVYSPLQTPLLKATQERGIATIDGLRMLLFQGVKQFELWTEKKAPLEVMQNSLYNIL
jgi:shikimate dehydrogenase